MSLVPSLLTAILRLDGEALVMHVGEKPYVVAPTGQVELATRPLNFDAVNGMVLQLLPPELQRALDEFGAVQYEFPPLAEFPNEHFSVVAALGGDDVWVEVRRRRVPDDYRIPEDFFTPAPVADVPEVPAPPVADEPSMHAGDDADLAIPPSDRLWPLDQTSGRTGDSELVVVDTPPAGAEWSDQAGSAPDELRAVPAFAVSPTPDDPRAVAAPPKAAVVPPALHPVQPVTPPRAARPVADVVRPPQPAVVLPLARSPIREEPAVPPIASTTGLDRLLRVAAARGASALYLTAQARPSMRVDGEIQPLAAEPPLSPSEVESLLIDLMPDRNREELRSGIATEWISDLAGVGRVRCMTFRDHRGPGGIFRMMPVHAISAEQLGLTREIQALASEVEGLVLVAGPRSSGKSMLVSAFVDLINRTRRDHVITIETGIKVVHEQRQSLVSQREVRGSADEMLAVARGALREDPDVLVVEDLRTAEMMRVALEAAGSGHLVIGALPAHTATGAVDRIIDLYPPEERRHVQLALSEHLRGVVAQVLVRKPAGGRIAAREVLLNTPAVARAIAEGKTSQLGAAIEGGRKYGMVPLNDALVALVQSGAIDSREGYRHAADRPGFLALLKRQGIDTTALERLA